MNEDETGDTVAEAWRLHRRRVLDVCYRMLGTLADAEDAVQETYARLVQRGTGDLDDVAGLSPLRGVCASTGSVPTGSGVGISDHGCRAPSSSRVAASRTPPTESPSTIASGSHC